MPYVQVAQNSAAMACNVASVSPDFGKRPVRPTLTAIQWRIG
jgi:hypothetical protein